MPEQSVILPKDTAQALVDLTGEPRVDLALTLLIREYARAKVTELSGALQRFEQKYAMPFEEYRQIWESEDRGEQYSYEAEQDYLEWEALVTRLHRLRKSFAWLP